MEAKNNLDTSTEALKKEQIDVALMIDGMTDEVLKKLNEGNTDVDIESLMEAIQEYSSYSSFHEPTVLRWKEKLAKITQILELHYKKLEEELQNMVESNPQVTAYNKTQDLKDE